jgi:hypothetical protein
LVKGEDIVKYIKAHRIKWVGIAYQGGRYKTNFIEIRNKGQPNSRWNDEVI